MTSHPKRHPKILYIHVPKCGGTSFGAALRMQFILSQATITLGQGNPALQGEARIIDDYRQRQIQLRRLVAQGKRMIAGHVQYDPDLHNTTARDYHHVTLLRDPAARLVSHYHYLQRHHPDPRRAATLGAFIETPDAVRLASQYLYYFAGQTQGRHGTDPALIDHAIANLARFDLVGNLAAPDAFRHGLKQLTGARTLNWRRNSAPAPYQIPPQLRAKLAALCAVDTRIFTQTLNIRAAA